MDDIAHIDIGDIGIEGIGDIDIDLFDIGGESYGALIDKCATINKPIPRGETWGVFTDKTTEQ